MKKHGIFSSNESDDSSVGGATFRCAKLEPDTAIGIRIGLNFAAIIFTGGAFHLAYYLVMAINWFIGQASGTPLFKNMEWDPFANISCLNPNSF